MSKSIYPCIWCDGTAKQAAELYVSIFPDAYIEHSSPMAVTVLIGGQRLMLLNGGPMFKPNATMSFYLTCETELELKKAYENLAKDGLVMMPLGKYDWSELYSWVQDRYGVSWQLNLGKVEEMGQRFVPALLYTCDQFGNAQSAIDLCTSIFENSKVEFVYHYPDNPTKIAHSQLRLLGQKFIFMDSDKVDQHFTEGNSLVILCDTQEDIDLYWDRLSEGGSESQCGWLKDRYGFSWQVVPVVLSSLLSDASRSERVMSELMKMRKLHIEILQNA